MLTEPLSVTYDGSAKSLPRISAGSNGTRYRTADAEFEMSISNFAHPRYGGNGVSIMLTRLLPDPTPSNVFDDYRVVHNSFGLVICFDPTRAETSVDVPRLRSALNSLVDTTLQGRLIGGER